MVKDIQIMPESRQIPSQPGRENGGGSPSMLPPPNPTLPFWMMDPNRFLLDHRTTADLPIYADRVIIGSGLTGTSAALYWTERDDISDMGNSKVEERVLMLEARQACSGATGRNGGHLQPLLTATTTDIGLFEQLNCKEVANIIHENSIPCEYRSLSACHTLWTDELSAKGRKAYERLEADAPEIAASVQWIDTEQEFIEAEVHQGAKGGTITAGAASLWPYKYITFLLEKLIKARKLNLQTNTPVQNISTVDNTIETSSIPLAARSRARIALHTSRGTVFASKVLLATNAYTPHLIPSFSDLIVPMRETMTAQLPPPAFQDKQLKYAHGFMGLGKSTNSRSTEYLNQRPFTKYLDSSIRGTGHFMLGGARLAAGVLPSVGEVDDSIVDESVVEYLQRELPQALRLVEDSPDKLKLEIAWSGIWAQSRDGSPWIGRVPGQPVGLWMAAAYSGHGMPNCSLCAKAVVKMMEKDATGQMEQHDLDELVRNNELPISYLIRPERLRRARQYPSVKEMDSLDSEPLQWASSKTYI